MAEKKYIVTKSGMVFDCKTEERYKSFIEDGWEKYTHDKAPKDNDPPKDDKAPKDNDPPKDDKAPKDNE